MNKLNDAQNRPLFQLTTIRYTIGILCILLGSSISYSAVAAPSLGYIKCKNVKQSSSPSFMYACSLFEKPSQEIKVATTIGKGQYFLTCGINYDDIKRNPYKTIAVIVSAPPNRIPAPIPLDLNTPTIGFPIHIKDNNTKMTFMFYNGDKPMKKTIQVACKWIKTG